MSETDPLRAANAAIAAAYDEAPFEPPALPLVDVPRLRGAAALYGEVRPAADVLDLGCGAGVQLERVAGQVSGRLVGTDISPQSCERARQRLTPFGDRVDIRCADLMDLEPESLGQFDVIYSLGVIFVVPPPVRTRLLALIGRCLRPGGVAVISYYAGSLHVVRANLHAMLRAAIPPGTSREQSILGAREALRQLGGQVANLQGGELMRAAIAETSRLPDPFFHSEVLNGAFDAARTTEIETALAAHGLSFITCLPGRGVGEEPTSKGRALAADALDFAHGAFHCGVFAKLEVATALDIATPRVVWESPFHRAEKGRYDGPAQFTQKGGGGRAGMVQARLTQALFDVLSEGPATWTEALAEADRRLAAAGASEGREDTATILKDFRQLWTHGILTPLGR